MNGGIVSATGVEHDGRFFLLWGRYGARSAWACPEWDGRPELGPHLLADGRDVMALIENGELDQLPFPVWFQRRNGTRLGDLLWAGGLATKLVSRRFVDVLERIDATGWKTYEVTFVDRKRIPIDGYVGIASTGADDHLDVSHSNGFQNFGLRVKPHVLHALLEAGVDGFHHEPHPLRT